MQLKKALVTALFTVTALGVPTITFGQAYGSVQVDTLNIRQEPSAAAENIGQLSKNDKVDIIDILDDEWMEIETSRGETAYVFSSYIKIKGADGEIGQDNVSVIDYPSATGFNVLGTLDEDDEVVINYTVDDWCNVTYDGEEGFVAKQYISSEFMNEVPVKQVSDAKRIKSKQNAEQSSSNSKGDAIVEDALQFVGNPYRYGGNSLTNGVDCSGFTQQIMKRHGINLSRSSGSQYANDGYKVSKDELQKGDLLFYGYKGTITHVAIYMGNEKIVHAGTSATGIYVSSMYEGGNPYVGAKRVY